MHGITKKLEELVKVLKVTNEKLEKINASVQSVSDNIDYLDTKQKGDL